MRDNTVRPLVEPTTGQIQAFWTHIVKGKPNECWEYRALNGERIRAKRPVVCIGPNPDPRIASYLCTRIAYYLCFQVDPYPYFVLHRCDNPHCCNPAHLFLGTNKDNMLDMVTKGRCKSGYASGRLTKDQVLAIRSRNAPTKKTQIALAAEFGIGYGMLRRILTGRSYKRYHSATDAFIQRAKRKLNDDQIRQIRAKSPKHRPDQLAIAAEYGVSFSTIYGIVTGRIHRHIY